MTNYLKTLIYSDIDGCLTQPYKIYGGNQTLKAFSDKDAFTISVLRPHIVLLTQDYKNSNWALHKDLSCVVAQQGLCGKYDALKNNWRQHIANGILAPETNGDPLNQYIYLGDSIYDLECLQNAAFGFVPKDHSIILGQKIKNLINIVVLESNGGLGCFEEMACFLAKSCWADTFCEGMQQIKNLLNT